MGCGRQWRKEGDRETKPEREPMTLEVTPSYHERPQSEGKNNEGFPCLRQPEDNPMATAPFLIPFSVCCVS